LQSAQAAASANSTQARSPHDTAAGPKLPTPESLVPIPSPHPYSRDQPEKTTLNCPQQASKCPKNGLRKCKKACFPRYSANSQQPLSLEWLIPSGRFELNVKFYGEPLEKVQPYKRTFAAFRNPISEHLALFCNLIDRHLRVSQLTFYRGLDSDGDHTNDS
jgi:hypothetical protein